MLILSRKPDEQIIIGDGIVITVVSIRGGKVRIGIEAPSSVKVHRQEVIQLESDEPSPGPSQAPAHGSDRQPGADAVD